MNKNKGVTSLLPILAMSCVLPSTAVKAQDSNDESFLIEEVYVVARKRAENIQEVPIPITALS